MSAAEIFDLHGKVALVTGASSGLGAHFAQVLAASGASVVLVARRAERLTPLQAQIAKSGGKAITVSADVRDRNAMAGAFDAAEKAFGTVTILVNNAGVAHAARAVELAEEEWRRVLSTDLDAVFFWAQEAARRMLAAKSGGSIVNIASVLGLTAEKRVIGYAVSKAGLVHLTRTLALELARHNIRVNAICPGYFPTEMTQEYLTGPKGEGLVARIPQRRLGAHADLEGPLLLLASDAGAYMTGSVLVVDGGYML